MKVRNWKFSVERDTPPPKPPADGRNWRRIALIAVPVLLLAAGGLAFLLLRGEKDEKRIATTADQLEIATAQRDLADNVLELASTEAPSPAQFEKAGVSANGLRVRLGNEATNPLAATSLINSIESLKLATAKLADAAGTLDSAQEGIDEDRVASDEASAELSGLASTVSGLAPSAEEAERDMRKSLLELAAALRALKGALREVGELDPTQEADLLATADRVDQSRRTVKQSFSPFGQRIAEVSSAATARSEELEPDVVLDCPQFGGVYSPSVRNMTCAEAEPLINEAIGLLAPSFSVGSFSCEVLGELGDEVDGLVYGASDVRCSSGDQAFRFDFSE